MSLSFDELLARARSRLAGEAAPTGLPTADAPDIPAEPGFLAAVNALLPNRVTGEIGFLGESALRDAAVPYIGILERLGLVESGRTSQMKQRFEEKRQEFLAPDPGGTRAVLAGTTEFATKLIPLAPGGALGKAAGGALARAAPQAGRFKKFLAGAAGAAPEAAIVAAGETVDLPEGEQLKSGLLMTAAGTLLGGSTGLAARGPRPDREASEFRKRFFSPDEPQKPPRQQLNEVLLRQRELWFDWLARVEDVAKRTGDEPFLKAARSAMQKARISRATAEAPVFHRVLAQDGTDREMGESLADIYFSLPDEHAEDWWLRLAAKREVDDLAEREALSKSVEGIAKSLKEASKERLPTEELQRRLVALEASVSSLQVGQKKALAAVRVVRDLHAQGKFYGAEYHNALDRVRGEELNLDPKAVKLAKEERARIEGKYDAETIRSFDALEDRYHIWSSNVMDGLFQVGVLSEPEIVRMFDANPNWAIFKVDRRLAEGRGIGIGPDGTPVKDKKIVRGLTEELKREPIPAGSGAWAMRIHQFVQMQRVKNLVADAAERFPEEITEIRRAKPKEKLRPGEASFTRWVNVDDEGAPLPSGQRVRYIAPKELVEAFTAMNPKEAKLLVNASRALTRTFRAGATLSPNFSFRNLGRDQLTFGVYSQFGGIPVIDPARFILREVFSVLRHGEPTKEWRQFMLTTGRYATFLSGDRLRLGDELSAAKRLMQGKKIESLRNPLTALRILSDAFERPGRFAEEMLKQRGGRITLGHLLPGKLKRPGQGPPVPWPTLGKGGLEEHGVRGLVGSDVTLNFAQGGRYGKRWNQHEAFFNAQLLDIDKFYRSMRDRPFGTITQGLTWLTLPAIANWLSHRDDEYYQKNMPEWEKILFWHIKADGDDDEPGLRPVGSRPLGREFNDRSFRYWRIPRPPGVLNLIFAYTVEKALDFFKDDDPRAIERLADAVVGQTPLQYLPGVNEPLDAVLEASPNIAQPMLEVLTNRDPFRQQTILSQRFQGVFGEEQRFETSSPTAIGIAAAGRGLGRGLGVDQGQGLADLSPIEVEHLIRGYGASLGQMGTQLADELLVASGAAAKLKPELPFSALDYQPVSGFVTRPVVGFGSEPVNRFYELSELAQKASRTFTEKIEKGDMVGAERIRRENPVMALAPAFEKVRAQLRGLGEQRQFYAHQENLEPAVRRDRLLQIDQMVSQTAAYMVIWAEGDP